MLTQKRNFSKKVIKEDSFVTNYYKTVKYFNDHRNIILISGLVIILIVAFGFYYAWNKEQNNEKASYQLAKAMNLYNAGAFQEAINGRPSAGIEGLKKVVDEYGSTENGETAKIFLANAYAMLGQIEEAYKTYDDYDGESELFQSTAVAGKASYYESKNEYLDAAKNYEEAAYISVSNPLNSDYLLKAGMNYLEAGKNENAVEMFEKLVNDYPASQAARSAERYKALAQ